MAEVKWIKVSTDMFETNRKIKQIELMPEGDTILVIWLKLLLLAGNVNDGGDIYLTPEIPYTDEMLANELRRPLATVRMALTLFEKFGMIEIIDDILHLSSWEKYQNVDKLNDIREYNRLAQQKSRARRKALAEGKEGVIDKSLTSQPCQDTEEDKEKEKDKEYHSIIHSNASEEESTEMQFDDREELRMKYWGGKLGGGVVFMNQEQFDDLLDKLSLDEFNKYFEIVRDCELAGKHFKNKTHYQAILDMALKDRKTKGGKADA